MPPCTASFVPTSAAAYMTPAARPRPAPGASSGAAGPIAIAATANETTNQPATASQEPVRARVRAAGERDREEDEADDGEADADPLAARERLALLALGEDREQREPAGRDGLDERERREPEREDVEHPARDPDQEGERQRRWPKSSASERHG